MDSDQNYKNLSIVGAKYRYSVHWNPCPDMKETVDDLASLMGMFNEDELWIDGTVLYVKDGVSILRVDHRYAEMESYVVPYAKVKTDFPDFEDPLRRDRTEYLCVDILSEQSMYYFDSESGVIFDAQFDENHFYEGFDLPDESQCDTYVDENGVEHSSQEILDNIKSSMEKLLHGSPSDIEHFKEEVMKFAHKEEQSDNVAHKNVNIILSTKVAEDLETRNAISEVLNFGLSRATQWLMEKDCAILTAWRSRECQTMQQNIDNNKELVESLRQYGYGVVKLTGCYCDTENKVNMERSFLVIDLIGDEESFYKNIFDSSKHYDQQCFLYKRKNDAEAYLVGTNDEFEIGRVVRAGALHINVGAQSYSRVGSGHFTFC